MPSRVTVGANGVGGGAGTPISTAWDSASGSPVNGRAYVTLSQAQVDLLHQSFKAAEDAVFKSFAVAAWVTPYVDQTGLSFDTGSGFGFDFSGMQASLDALHVADARTAAITLLEIDKFAGDSLRQMGWTGLEKLSAWVEEVTGNPDVQATLTDLGIVYGGGILAGTSGDTRILGFSGNGTVTDSGGNDTIDGGAGDDVISDQGGGTDVIYGGAGNDTITDGGGNNTIDAGAGNDVVTVTVTGTSTVLGGDGNDTLTLGYGQGGTLAGGAGDDVLTKTDSYAYGYLPTWKSTSRAGYYNMATTYEGGTGNDRLVGSGAAETYFSNRGDGQDTINDYDGANLGKTDKIVFGTGIVASDSINSDQLWFRHVGNNLEVSVLGSAEAMTIENWYSSSAYHVEQFSTADGKLLLDSQVENLVQAMAAFAPPAAGERTLPPAYQEALTPVIANNWQ